MTAPDLIEALLRRVEALEADQFALTEKVRRYSDVAERTANSLDDLEEVLTDLSFATARNTDAMAAAMTQRQAQLDAESEPELAALTGELVPVTPGRDGTPPPPEDGQGGGVNAPDMAVLHAWVETHIAPMTRKTTTTGEGGGIRWCRQWWEHHDAVERFIALFLAFKELSAAAESATWLSVYLRDHLDPHLAVLTSPYGPFYACSPRKHSDAFEPLGHAELAQHQGGSQP